MVYDNESNPSHSYGVSLAIWDHTVLPATRHKRTHSAFTWDFTFYLLPSLTSRRWICFLWEEEADEE